MKVAIVTGGSGGHIYPALTFADTMKNQRNHDVVFIGNDHKMESWIIPEAGYPFFAIHNQGLQGSVLDRIKAVFSQFKALRAAKTHLINIKPDVVISFGGYVSAPVAYAASNLGIPLIVHEQNAFPGKANRMIIGRAKAVITCYPEAFSELDTVHMLGNPRASLIHETIDSTKEFQRLNLDPNKPLVLGVMGSQGSASMNEKFLEFIKHFDSDAYQVVITTGPTNLEDFESKMTKLPKNIRVTGFVDQKALLPHIRLIVCRSGASTIAEIESFGIPSLLIPSPHVANNHQFYNAKSLYDTGAADMIEESEIVEDVLVKRVDALMNDPERLASLSENAKKRATPNAVTDICDLVESVVS